MALAPAFSRWAASTRSARREGVRSARQETSRTACTGPAGAQGGRPSSRRISGLRARARPAQGGRPVKREISRAARISSAKLQRGQPIWHEISRPRAGARPGARRSAGQAGGQPDPARELGRRKELGRSNRRSAGPRASARPSRTEVSRSGTRSAGPRMSSAKPEGSARSDRRSARHMWTGPHGAALRESAPWAGPHGRRRPR